MSNVTPSHLSPQGAVWRRGRFRPFLIATWMSCLALGLGATLSLIPVPFPVGYFVPATFLVSLIGVHLFRYFTARQGALPKKWQLVAAQAILLLMLARILTLVAADYGLSIALLQDWFWSPATFFDVDFLLLGAILLIVWRQSTGIEQIFWRLGDEQHFTASRPNSSGTEVPSHGWGGEAITRLSGTFFAGAVFLLLLASLSQIPLGDELAFEMAHDAGGLPPELAVALLAWTTLGLIMISQARLISLQAGWMAQNVAVTPRIRSAWIPMTLLFVTTIALLATQLPDGSLSGLAAFLNAAIQVIMELVAGIIGFFLALLALLLSAVGLQTETVTAPSVQTEPFAMPTAITTPSEHVSHAGPIALWVFVIMAVAYSVFLIARATSVSDGFSLAALRGWIWSLLMHTHRSAEAVERSLRTWRRLRPASIGRSLARATERLIRVRTKTPRERLRRHYITALRHAARAGYPRTAVDTPAEHQRDLVAARPDMATDWQDLTDAFILARYSRRPISADQELHARSVLQRLIHQIRKIK